MQNIYTHKNHTHKPTNKKHTCITCSSAWKKLSIDTSKILLQYKHKICRFLKCMKPLPILHMWTAAQQNQQNDPCTQRRLGSAWASVQSDQSFIHRLHEEIVGAELPTEDSDQTGRMPSLIWVFAWCTCHFVGFVVQCLMLSIWHAPSTCSVI